MTRLAGVLIVGLALSSYAAAQAPEILGEVRVHGNHTTPDGDILSLAGLTIGAPLTEADLRAAEERLRGSGRFDSVEVRKRLRSIDDPSDVLVIILVDEVAGITNENLTPGPLTRLRSLGMWLPVVDYADGYGWTYGARISFVEALGARSRISMPLTWGGERKAAVEIDRSWPRGPLTRVAAWGSIGRRNNPHFDVGETRRALGATAERAVAPWLRISGGATITNVRFGALDDTFVTPRAEVALDTRGDPAFPRNAVHVVAAIEQLRFDGAPAVRRHLDARGYIGVFRSAVLAVRAAGINASDPLPPYEQALLGGISTLRGYDFGARAGDNLAALSAELSVPLTSPLSVGRFGLKGFIDAGTVYAAGATLADQPFDRGAGVGVFITWAVIRMGLDVAWPIGAPSRRPNWHFGLGVTF